MDIKLEDNKYTICIGCLSTNREMTPSFDFKLYLSLLGDQITDYDVSKCILLCWECNAKLKKVQLFQHQIKTAQVAHLQYIYHNAKPPGLSSLSVTLKDSYDCNYIYCDNPIVVPIEIVPQDIVKEELDDDESWDMTDNDIAKEDFDITKDEYMSPYLNDIDNETTKETINKTKRKNKCSKEEKKRIKLHSIKRYEEYARVVQTAIKDEQDISKLYEKVILSESEIEEVLAKHKKDYGYYKLPFMCDICMKSYKRKTDLNRHNDLNHKKIPPYICSECRCVSKSDTDLRTHWRQHSEMARCVSCWEMFRSRGELRKHLNREHSTLYYCRLCDMQCSNLRKFSQHYRNEHERYICDYCQSRFTVKHVLEKHIIRQHLPPTCELCRHTFISFRSLQRHLARHKEPRNIEAAYCVECDKQFPTVHKFRNHIKTSPKHTPQPKMSIPCPDCGKIFTRKNYMNNHFKQVHSKTTRHYCSICNKLLITGYALRNHMKHVHEKKMKPKDKICDLCGRGFSTNRILVNHIRTHTGERPFKCAYCPASFAQQTAMKSHEKSQHMHHANNTFGQ